MSTVPKHRPNSRRFNVRLTDRDVRALDALVRALTAAGVEADRSKMVRTLIRLHGPGQIVDVIAAQISAHEIGA